MSLAAPFSDRTEAGQALAQRLAKFAGCAEILVLGLPRGGVPVAAEVARTLGAPLDIFMVRKLGMPGQEELALGAIASGGVCVLNDQIVAQVSQAHRALAKAMAVQQRELERREQAYRQGQTASTLTGRTVLLVDDGLATGASMRAAVAGARQLGAECVVVAAPVGAREPCAALAREADEVVCLLEPAHFGSVGQFYVDFSQTSDADVCALLAKAAERTALARSIS